MMKRYNLFSAILVFSIVLLVSACKPEPDDNNINNWTYNPEIVPFPTPKNFPPPTLPEDNPLTKQGIKLGRLLVYDPILSDDSTLSCMGCHHQSNAFVDLNNRFSKGIDGIAGKRNAMPLFNLAWHKSFFWDGRSATLEQQILKPVEDPIEMHETWPDAINKLSKHKEYPRLFYEAFGEEVITKELAAKAMAQFLRTIISSNSRYDKYLRGELFGTADDLTDEEQRGLELILTEPIAGGADCFHCHDVSNQLFLNVNITNQFRNNGLQEAASINDFVDKGRGPITSNNDDYGKFKIPTLRNLTYTAPYMHNGMFNTIDEVLDFYNGIPKNSPTLDPLMTTHRNQNGLNLSDDDKKAIKAFILALTDESFLNIPDYSKPSGF
jgi:cytochrome c peroxidase